jgi:ubiquinone/menaquinone biosynthesis C-methylase UbiE
MNLWWRLLRFGFRLLYNELAFTYDLVSSVVSLGAWHDWQRSALKHLNASPGARVLELAHGTGNLQLDLNTAGYRVTGYDLSPYMGRITRAKLRRNHLPVRLARGTAQKLPFPANTFNAVVCTFPTNFIVEPETLAEVRRVLRDDGRFVIVPNGALTGAGPVETGIEWLYHITGQRDGATGDIAAFFATYGFEARVVEERCPRSVAQVIIAQKKV